MSKHIYRIAIDGPAGSGKSTVARELARQLGISHLDTGSMFRGVSLFFLDQGIDPSIRPLPDEVKTFLDRLNIEFKNNNIYLNDLDVTSRIRSEEVNAIVSTVSTIPEVRNKLKEIQQRIASSSSIVMDGRDIGTVVLPKAELKIFLTATAEKRAERRYLETKDKQDVSFEKILKDIKKRDFIDSSRKIAPLKIADDAIVIDTTNLTIKEVVEKIISLM